MDISFKAIVNSTHSSLEPDSLNDLGILYKHYKLEYGNALTLESIQSHLYERIQNNLKSSKDSSKIHISELFTLRNQLLLSYFVNGEKIQPYLEILNIVIDAARGIEASSNAKIIGFDNTDNWKVAIEAAWDFVTLNGKNKISDDKKYLKTRYTKQWKISESAKFLKSMGYEIEIKDGKVLLEESQARKIACRIESNIKLLGGIETLRRLFEQVQHRFDEKQERYHLGRYFREVYQHNAERSIPFNYLLNLCVKHTQKTVFLAVASPDSIWKEILDYSIVLASILDVEPSNQLSLLFHSTDTIVQFLQELATYDNLFCPIQLRPSDIPKIIRGLFSSDAESIQNTLNWTPEQAAIVTEKILAIAQGKRYLIRFTTDDIFKLEPHIEKSIIELILNVFSNDASSVNLNFQIPQDISKIGSKNYFGHKPIIKLSENEYLLISPSICATAFYEAIIFEIDSQVNINIHNKTGEKIEELIKKELSNREIKYFSGKYKNDKSQGKNVDESDILVETDDTLIFFEVKKKSLVRQSKSGDSLKILIDLSKSLLETQRQINKHEIFIKKYGKIEFKDNSICYLNNKKIARISITLSDFGSFQDRNVLFQFMGILLLGKLESTNMSNINLEERSDLSNKIEKLNQKIDDFKNQIDEIYELDNDNKKNSNYFYNCWFLSVPQLLVILDNVQSSNELKQELWRTRSMSISSLDFYREYAYARKLEEH
ncbi:MAG: hypothetical protein ACLFT0_09135 [Spirulinaceae cyanobacterium]